MQFTTSQLFTVLLSAASVLGAPTASSSSTPAGSAGLTKRGSGSFVASAIFQYDVSTGAIDCTVSPNGLVQKHPQNGGHDITTLLTFVYPATPANAMCTFDFSLAPTDTLTGSGLIDVFSSNSPAPGCTQGWGPGNQRNQHLGRVQVGKNGQGSSVWVQTETGLSTPQPCKPAGTVEAFELVGVYDYDYAAWSQAVSGASITYTF